MRNFFLRLATKHFKWVSEDDLFEVTLQGITHKGRLLNPERAIELSEKAGNFRRSFLWKVLSDEIKYTAHLIWLKQGDDLSARMLLRAEEVISKKLESLGNLKVDKK